MHDLKNQEIENKKRHLKRYRRNRLQVERLYERLDALESRLTTLRSPTLSDMPRGGDRVTVDDLLSDKMDLEKRIEEMKVVGREYRREICSDIDTLDNDVVAEVLECYFIDCMEFYDIAKKLAREERWIIKLYSRGIKQLCERDGTVTEQ